MSSSSSPLRIAALACAFVFACTPALAGTHAPAAAPATAPSATRFAQRFVAYGHRGAFVLQRDGQTPQALHDDAWSTRPLRPASTFKIMVSLIALETGVLKDEHEIVRWDGTRYPDNPDWQRDMTLREAMRSSSEPFFLALAKRIGHDRLADWVERAHYGNGRIGPDPARAWHDGVLTVTALQQVDFVDRLRRESVPFSRRAIALTKAAMLDSERNGQRVYGKTGTYFPDDGSGHAWWVGWTEGGHAPAASFALCIELKTMDTRERRIVLGKQLLRDAGVLAP